MRFCNYCGNYLSDKWKYCPYCGKPVRDGFDLFDALLKSGITGISIRITSRNGEEPDIKVRRIGRQKGRRVPIESIEREQRKRERERKEKEIKRRVPIESKEDTTIRPIPKKVVEPEGRKRQLGDHIVLLVKLPGVKKEDINVRKLEESVEVKAYKNGEAYFKQFPVPQSARIISKRMEGDQLIVEVG
ncbi:MAG: zinc-ribbon domain-containing protein [Candidatus Methanofastidiosia archaeon]|jgi:HSP20 family molecular chaperone IbpA